MSSKIHEERGASQFPTLKFGIVSISSSRFESRARGAELTDESGDLAEDAISNSGHTVAYRCLVDDDVLQIRHAVLSSLVEHGCDVCVTLGGTGVSPRDVTYESVSPLLEKELPGFAELFRSLSLREIGEATVATRCVAGVTHGRLIVSLPGSPDAVRLGARLVLSQARHLVSIARQGSDG